MDELEKIAKTAYGRQNEVILENLDKYIETNKELHKNITFLETCNIDYKLKNNKQKFTIECDHSQNSQNSQNSQKFIKNIRIKGLNRTSRWTIALEIGCVIIDSIYDVVYDVILSKDVKIYDNALNKIFCRDITSIIIQYIVEKDTLDRYLQYYCEDTIKDTIILPYDILPLPKYHDICIYVKSNIINDKLLLLYDVYHYNNPNPNKDSLDFYYRVFEQIIYQVQYYEPETIYNKYTFRLNFNHPINCIAINVPKGMDKNIAISFDGTLVKIPLLYRDGKFAVYKFPYINFTRIDSAILIINDNRLIENLRVFAFNIQLGIYRLGMYGLAFGY
jgi:hypothetical protein